MWPAGQQQQPGDGNPQHQGPPGPGPHAPHPHQQPGYQQPGYQQSGYQQPNPYQQPPGPGGQPGYQQPGLYQQTTVSQPTVSPYPVAGPPPGPPGNRRKTAVVAVVAALAVVAAAVVTGVVVLGGDRDTGDRADPQGGGASAGSAETAETAGAQSPPPVTSTEENPRAGKDAEPTVPGWKVVINPQHGTMFDVPPEWTLMGAGMQTGYEDEKKGDGTPAVVMSAPAQLRPTWCLYDYNKDGTKEDWGLATAGTKGARGARSTADAAYNEAFNWAWAAYAQGDAAGTVKVARARPFTTASGLAGSVATATATGTKKRHACETDGKSTAFSFKDSTGEIKTFVLHGVKGVKGELPEATVQKILGTIRQVKAAGG
ncbi:MULTISPECIES: hypothetical protein [Streptomyces]|uniref:DUF8017 domain-containing protein n=1 Tax=Streptomyces tsukubensis (strain DSM 42081 / NBRC 108919 / NRRL 18488 / 9993) TaxID=1114943 RepID=I2MUU9_STRT9|nr:MULTISPECIES: hypothetical protein [Streptomyces]AZK93037.1 hypothetical protein B7R87_03435 [Streptomyces tsukubensis]EIF88546.1 hypothetical protein [Streptomyces tsukubensis NRRL18488]MYS67052.1 hypothetical protein [Streptomyces sp. SID5473]QKM70799.1 hypothetical protein STSU_030395 [Streptomyces tsukubensis NRRL18488]TAI41083.1 hypothetical protein EWI31_29450 [Streptomyces tsukubensis]